MATFTMVLSVCVRIVVNQSIQRYFFEDRDTEHLQDLVEACDEPEALPDNRDEHVGSNGDPDLRLDRVRAGAEERLDPRVLLDPLEEQLRLSAAAIGVGDDERRQREVVVREGRGLGSLGVGEADAPNRSGYFAADAGNASLTI